MDIEPVGGHQASAAMPIISEMTNNDLLLFGLPQSKVSHVKERQQKQQAHAFIMLSMWGVRVHSVLN